jgi:hypothetical protein
MHNKLMKKVEITMIHDSNDVAGCSCARMRQAIRARGKFGVFSATTKHHGFTLGTDDLLRQSPYLATCLE